MKAGQATGGHHQLLPPPKKKQHAAVDGAAAHLVEVEAPRVEDVREVDGAVRRLEDERARVELAHDAAEALALLFVLGERRGERLVREVEPTLNAGWPVVRIFRKRGQEWGRHQKHAVDVVAGQHNPGPTTTVMQGGEKKGRAEQSTHLAGARVKGVNLVDDDDVGELDLN